MSDQNSIGGSDSLSKFEARHERRREKLNKFARQQQEKNIIKLQELYARYATELAKATISKPALLKRLAKERALINTKPKEW